MTRLKGDSWIILFSPPLSARSYDREILLRWICISLSWLNMSVYQIDLYSAICVCLYHLPFIFLDFSNIFKCPYYLPAVYKTCMCAKYFLEDAKTMTEIAWSWYTLIYHRAALIQCLEPNTYNLFLLALFSFIMY